jgi:hypothetical protein
MTLLKRIPKTTTDLTDWSSFESANDSALSGKAAASHSHTLLDVSDAGSVAALDAGTSAGEVPVLDGGGKLPVGIIPAVALSEFLGAPADETAMLLLTGQPGDYCRRVDDGTIYILTAADATVLANWVSSAGGGGGTTSIDGLSGGQLTSAFTSNGVTSNVSISGAVITAGGTDAAVQVKLVPKGAAGVSLNGGNATGQQSFASNLGATASGSYSVATGHYATASNFNATASSYNANASGYCSTASNFGSIASGTCAASSGYNAIAAGDHACASGQSSEANGGGSTASGAYAVADGAYSVASGYGAQAQGNMTTASGYNSTASGLAAIADGYFATASGTYSYASGNSSVASRYGQRSVGLAANYQTVDCLAKGSTTDATETEIFLDGSSARLTLATNQALAFVATIFGRRTDAAGTYQARIVGNIQSVANTVSFPVTPSIGDIIDTSGGSYDAVVEADDTNKALVFKVTGAASHTMRWFIRIEATEITW